MALIALAAAVLLPRQLGQGDSSALQPKVTQPAPSNTFVPSGPGRAGTVWAVGDGADGGSHAKAVAARITRLGIDRLLYLGDVYQTGSPSDFADHYATTYGRFARITAPTPGNHDWGNHARGYDPYWARARGRPTPPYYAFSVAGWEIISLNSEIRHDARSAQVRWLRTRLRRPGTCRIAFWHRPRYSAGLHGDAVDTQPLWEALRGHARVVLTGHDHDMQRLAPRDGVVELVSGAGGHGLYALKDDPRVEFGDGRDYGALRLDLHPGKLRYSFISAAGESLDAGRISCRTS